MPISRWPAQASGSGGSLYWGDAVANVGSLPAGVATGEIRLALDSQILYKWNGAAWVLYLDISTLATASALTSHTGDTANPHAVTKTQVGLSNVDNTSDASKPVSTAQAAADSAVQAFAIQRSNHTGTQAAGTITGLAAVATSGAKADVGLGNVDNTSDVNKPVSTAQAAADAAVLTTAEAYTDTAVANLVNAAPATLDTLEELANALGDDPNFATTTATALGNRLRVDTAAQGLSGAEKTNAKTNIDLQNVDNTSDATKWAATAVVTNKDYDGGTASNTNRITIPKNTTSNLSGLTRKQGALLYDSSLLKLLVDDGTNLNQVGSGSGAGGVTLIANPSDATGWSETGTVFATPVTTTTAGDLPLGGATSSAIQFVATNSGAEASHYCSYPITTSAAMNGSLQVDLFMRPGTGFAASEWTISVYEGATRKSLRHDSSSVSYLPNGIVRYTTSFDAIASTAYTLRFARVSGSGSATLNVCNVFLGWPFVSQTAAVSNPTTYVPTTPNSSFSATTALGTTNMQWRQVGSYMHLEGYFTVGTVQAQPARVSLPSGYTVGTVAGTSNLIFVGKWARNNAAATGRKQGVVQATPGTTYLTFGLDDTALGTSPASILNADTIISTGEVMHFSGEIAVPIAEWAGSGLSIGPGSEPEYLSYFDAAATTAATTYSDQTKVSRSPLGSQYAAIASSVSGGNATFYEMNAQYPLQVGDIVELRTSSDTGATWQVLTHAVNGASPYGQQGTNLYGLGIDGNAGATKVKAKFGNYGRVANNASFAGAGAAWSDLSASSIYRWCVRIYRNGQLPFAKATATNSGLVAPRKGQYAATVTCTQAGWSANSQSRATYYQDQDGNHRLKFNFAGTITSTSSAISCTMAVTGVTLKSTSGFFQAINLSSTGSAPGAVTQAVTDPSNNRFSLSIAAGTTVNGLSVSGDVELDSKPSWA